MVRGGRQEAVRRPLPDHTKTGQDAKQETTARTRMSVEAVVHVVGSDPTIEYTQGRAHSVWGNPHCVSPLPTTSHMQGGGNGMSMVASYRTPAANHRSPVVTVQKGMSGDTTLSGLEQLQPVSLQMFHSRCLSTALFQRFIYYGKTHAHHRVY